MRYHATCCCGAKWEQEGKDAEALLLALHHFDMAHHECVGKMLRNTSSQGSVKLVQEAPPSDPQESMTTCSHFNQKTLEDCTKEAVLTLQGAGNAHPVCKAHVVALAKFMLENRAEITVRLPDAVD